MMQGTIAIFSIKTNDKQDKKNNNIASTNPVLNEIIKEKLKKKYINKDKVYYNITTIFATIQKKVLLCS